MTTKTFEATAEQIADVKAALAKCEHRTVISDEGAVSYLFKLIDFAVEEVEGGISLTSGSAGFGDFSAEGAWIQRVLDGDKEPCKAEPAPAKEYKPVPAEIVNPAPVPSAARAGLETVAGDPKAAAAAIAASEARTVVSEADGEVAYLFKGMDFFVKPAEGGFTLSSPSAGPADFLLEAAWVEGAAAPAEEAPKAEAAPAKEEAPAPKPAEKPAEKPAPASEPVAVAPSSEPEDNTMKFALAAGIAVGACLVLTVIRKIFK